MNNVTPATAVTSSGSEAPAGLSTSYNSALLQASLAADDDPDNDLPWSDPFLFNNIFWDNRAGFYTGNTVGGIGLPNDPFPINRWDIGIAGGDPLDLLTPTFSILQTMYGTAFDPSNLSSDPLVVSEYDTGIEVLPWRGNPRFVDVLMIVADPTANELGDYHLQPDSPAIGAAGPFAPIDDYDGANRDTEPDIGADEWGAE